MIFPSIQISEDDGLELQGDLFIIIDKGRCIWCV